MYHTTMKQIILSTFILFTFTFVSPTYLYAQEGDVTNDITQDQEENMEDVSTEQKDETDSTSLEEALQKEETKETSFTFFQIFVAVTAPLTFFALAYLLIKKLKL